CRWPQEFHRQSWNVSHILQPIPGFEEPDLRAHSKPRMQGLQSCFVGDEIRHRGVRCGQGLRRACANGLGSEMLLELDGEGKLLLLELQRLRIVWIFCPRHPNLADFEFAELGRVETGNMILVGMSRNDHREFLIGYGGNVVDDLVQSTDVPFSMD